MGRLTRPIVVVADVRVEEIALFASAEVMGSDAAHDAVSGWSGYRGRDDTYHSLLVFPHDWLHIDEARAALPQCIEGLLST